MSDINSQTYFDAAAALGDGPKSHIIDELNKVLRGEISAIEAYSQVIEKFHTDPAIDRLTVLKREHEDNVTLLRDMLNHEGALPAETSGVWGAIVKTVVAAGKLLGEPTAIGALKQGEEHGLKLYRNLLDENLSTNDLRLIKDKLIPRQERHIQLLDQMSSTHH